MVCPNLFTLDRVAVASPAYPFLLMQLSLEVAVILGYQVMTVIGLPDTQLRLHSRAPVMPSRTSLG